MSYVVYNTATTRIETESRRFDCFKTEAAAKAARTRMIRNYGFDPAQLAVAELGFYQKNVEKQVERVNLISGQKFMESVNTPSYCSPSSEAYWSM